MTSLPTADGSRATHLLTPARRDYAFGGTRLGRYGKAPSGRLAETWEFSLYPGRESRLRAGGEGLDAFVARAFGLDRAARAGLPLVKLLDVSGQLPVHCHPNDAQAQSMEEPDPGKDEAWLILEAGPEAAVFLGFVDAPNDQAIRRALADGSLRERMVRLTPQAGDVVMVPAGTAHSARDVVLWEVQQTSDRSLLAEETDLWQRPLPAAAVASQLSAFLAVARREPPAPALWAAHVLPTPLGAGRRLLAGCAHVVMEAIDGNGAIALPAGAYTVAAGTVRLDEGEACVGDSFVVTPTGASVGAGPDGARLLRAWREDEASALTLQQEGRYFEGD